MNTMGPLRQIAHAPWLRMKRSAGLEREIGTASALSTDLEPRFDLRREGQL